MCNYVPYTYVYMEDLILINPLLKEKMYWPLKYIFFYDAHYLPCVLTYIKQQDIGLITAVFRGIASVGGMEQFHNCN